MTYRHILVPTDGSTLSLKAVRTAARLAGPLKARVTALHVLMPTSPQRGLDSVVYHASYTVREYERDVRKVADDILAEAAGAAGGAKVDTATVVHPHPWEAIIEAARTRKCDLIVMASHGRRGLDALLLGSETQKVLTHSKTPVLVCR